MSTTLTPVQPLSISSLPVPLTCMLAVLLRSPRACSVSLSGTSLPVKVSWQPANTAANSSKKRKGTVVAVEVRGEAEGSAASTHGVAPTWLVMVVGSRCCCSATHACKNTRNRHQCHVEQVYCTDPAAVVVSCPHLEHCCCLVCSHCCCHHFPAEAEEIKCISVHIHPNACRLRELQLPCLSVADLSSTWIIT